MSHVPRGRVLLLALSLLFTLTACAGAAPADDASAADATAPADATPAADGGDPAVFPVSVTVANGEVTIAERPTDIVSLSPTATEMLFAIGAADQVAAVDEFSTYPPEAPTTELSGFEPNVEAIAGYEPDLVVIADDGADLTSALGELDIPVLVAPAAATLDDSYEQVEQLGAATGNADGAAALIDQMRDEIDGIATSLPETDASLTYYHELDDTYYSVTSDTFIGQLYALVGLTNIADEAGGNAGGYPQLSEEFIVDADPDLIFLADTRCCDQSAETVAQRPGWGQITAVREGGVIELDDDIASRWGPRVVDLLRTVSEAVAEHADA